MPPKLSLSAERRLLIYIGAVVAAVLGFLVMLPPSADFSGHLASKTRMYHDHAREFDIVFIGDSRTYCAFHPHEIEQRTGRSVVNLAAWAHWLPSQYPQIQDIAPSVPSSATVVWSIGFQNFLECVGCVNAPYPISPALKSFYESLGLPAASYAHNLGLALEPRRANGIHTARLPELYERSVDWLMEPLLEVRRSSRSSIAPEHLSTLPHVADAKYVHAGSQVTSVAVRFKQGGYERIEIDHDFFRRQQAQHQHRGGVAEQVVAMEPFVRLFQAGLDEFKKHGVRLIVNVLEEAPHTYLSREVQLAQRSYMDTVVRKMVEDAGHTYMRVDFDRIDSSYYFDYNHVNSRGAQLLMDLVVAEMTRIPDAIAGL